MINEAIRTAMSADERVICYGLEFRIRRVFWRQLDWQNNLELRVFDVPTSENAFTGVEMGASMTGLLP